jgi:hypothetical protein
MKIEAGCSSEMIDICQTIWHHILCLVILSHWTWIFTTINIFHENMFHGTPLTYIECSSTVVQTECRGGWVIRASSKLIPLEASGLQHCSWTVQPTLLARSFQTDYTWIKVCDGTVWCKASSVRPVWTATSWKQEDSALMSTQMTVI